VTLPETKGRKRCRKRSTSARSRVRRIGGKLAQMGQRLIDGASKSLTEDFFSRFEQVLKESLAPEEKTEVVTPEATPAIARSVSVWVWVAGALLLGVAVYFLR